MSQPSQAKTLSLVTRYRPDKATQLLGDAYHLAELARLGHQAHRWLRKPPAQLTMLVLQREAR